MKATVITLAVGRSKPVGLESYARKIGADPIVISEPLDQSDRAAQRSVSWQKLLIPERFSQYDRLAILDSDIAINPDSPSIFDHCPPERIGGVISGSHIREELRPLLLARLTDKPRLDLNDWRTDQARYYADCGLRPAFNSLVNAGVLVANPAIHCGVFEGVYNREAKETRCYEQVPLSHAILSADLFHQLDSRFNSVLYETLLVHHHYLFTERLGEEVTRAVVRSEFANNFFLHFAYNQSELMRFL